VYSHWIADGDAATADIHYKNFRVALSYTSTWYESALFYHLRIYPAARQYVSKCTPQRFISSAQKLGAYVTCIIDDFGLHPIEEQSKLILLEIFKIAMAIIRPS